MMFSAAAARRTNFALTRSLRTPTTISRNITLSAQSRPLRHLPIAKTPNAYISTPSLFPSPSRHVLKSPIQTRSLSYLQRTRLGVRHARKGIWRKNPVLLPIALVSVLGASLFFAYIVYIELTENAPQYHKFPPEVAKPLRQAIYYTDVDLNPREAMKYYKQALVAATAVGMHPLSDDIVGIPLKAAEMLEEAGMVEQAIKYLSQLQSVMLKNVEKGRKAAAERKEILDKHDMKVEEQVAKKKKTEANTFPHAMQPTFGVSNPQILDDYEHMQQHEEWEEQQRDKAMKKIVGISLKIAELYTTDQMHDLKKAESAQEKAVELAMKELTYRQASGLPVHGKLVEDDDEDAEPTPWLTTTEVSVCLSDLAQTYLATGHEDLSLPLFLRALELLRAEDLGQPTCRQLHMITNIAVALGVRAMIPFRVEDPEAARQQTLANAKTWALKGIAMFDEIPDDIRGPECTLSRLFMKHNLGEWAERAGNWPEAKKWHKEAVKECKEFYKDQAMDTEDDLLYNTVHEAWHRVASK